jgi:hypothetical protein
MCQNAFSQEQIVTSGVNDDKKNVNLVFVMKMSK